MIARHEAKEKEGDLWARIAAPLPNDAIQWRQDGRPITRDGKYFARFVCYVDAQFVRERLDSVVPGEWDLSLELLPPMGGEEEDTTCAFKARLQILGVIREDVGMGKDYKAASSDAFKRAAVRFGVAHELYATEQNWVQVDGEGRYAKPLEDPAVAYQRRHGKMIGRPSEEGEQRPRPTTSGTTTPTPTTPRGSASNADPDSITGLVSRITELSEFSCFDDKEREHAKHTILNVREQAKLVRYLDQMVATARKRKVEVPDHLLIPTSSPTVSGGQQGAPADEPPCPKCGGRMWDNRASKRNAKAPDFKCRSRSCDGVVWPAKPREQRDVGELPGEFDDPSTLTDEDDDLPF